MLKNIQKTINYNKDGAGQFSVYQYWQCRDPSTWHCCILHNYRPPSPRLKSHSPGMVSVKSGYADNHPWRLHFSPVYFNCSHSSAKNKRGFYAPREFPMVFSSALTRPSFPCVCQYGLKPTLFLSEDKWNRVSPVWRRAHVVSDFLPLFAEQRNRVAGAKDRFS